MCARDDTQAQSDARVDVTITTHRCACPTPAQLATGITEITRADGFREVRRLVGQI
jgi:hypothetical protein